MVNAEYADHSKFDRCSICQEDYLNLPMSQVLFVTLSYLRGSHIVNGIRIIMRPGALENHDYFDNTTADLTGYAKARIFYTPRFGAIDDKPDPRVNTIHWEPNVVTDRNGEATLSFFNNAFTGKLRVIVQGVTEGGTPLMATTNYLVK